MSGTTLVIMAAGLGSRFKGGVKQLTSFGPDGEILMEYAIYDALEAGFDKVIFVIRHSMEKDFREIVGDKIAKRVPVSYAYQELEDLPEGFTVPKKRKKPWGTGQAILSCRGLIDGPFAVINADDFYGKDAFISVHDYLISQRNDREDKYHFCMAGFTLKNTLSDFGGVTRGICRVSKEGRLIEIQETKDILKTPKGAAVYAEDASLISVDPDSIVSMNFWGFTPDFLDELGSGFQSFLENLDSHNEVDAEFLLPTIIDRMLKEDSLDLTVLPSKDRWFGVTFKEDAPHVKQEIQNLIDSGKYPEKLF